MLKIAWTTLIVARKTNTIPKPSRAPIPYHTPPRTQNTKSKATLMAGPAAAIPSSDLADDGSFSNSATPPNKNRVIALIRTPNRRATTEWASSCNKSDAKKPSIAMIASSKGAAAD